MILGRNPALWVSLVAAILNVLVVVIGIPLSAEGVAALNGLGLVVIGLVANVSDPSTGPTFTAALKNPTITNLGSTK